MSLSFASRLQSLRERMNRAALKSGRDVEKVTLVAISKTHSKQAIIEASQAGIRHFGESKIQEMAAKVGSETLPGYWHFIGHLQKNKARDAVFLFSRIDSIDSVELATEINRRADATGKEMAVLLQVNVAAESTKSGVASSNALKCVVEINKLKQLRLEGLMMITPYNSQAEKGRPLFAQLRELRDSIESETGFALPVLSMGMSHDMDIAIEEGATEVRVGTDLFGIRKSPYFRNDKEPTINEKREESFDDKGVAVVPLPLDKAKSKRSFRIQVEDAEGYSVHSEDADS